MEKEKLRLKTAYLLLGCKKQALFVSAFPIVLKFLLLSSAVLLALQRDAFFGGKSSGMLLFLALSAEIGGFVLLRCFVLLRFRWFSLRSRSEPTDICSLIAGCSFSDFRLAVKLWIFSVMRRVSGLVLFLLFPAFCSVCALGYFSNGVSFRSLAAVSSGLLLLWAVGSFFFFSSVCATRAVCAVCCFEKKRVFAELWRKSAVMDKNALEYVKFKLFFYPWFGSKKLLANAIYVRKLFSENAKLR